MKNYRNLIIGIVLIALAVMSRTIFHMPNFTALAGIGLFAGFYFRSKIAYLIPLLAVLISDSIIGFYDLGTMVFVYLAWLFPVMIGRWNLKFHGLKSIFSEIVSVGFKAILASLSFYMISNLGVWLFSGMYVLNIEGIIECYVLALPFFRMTILGDLLFTLLIFGSYYIVTFLSNDKQTLDPVYVKRGK